MSIIKKSVAELLGTFWLVLGGCGTAVLAGHYVGFAGVALAFGLTVLTGAYAFGHISGGHFNPAVTLGLLVGGRCSLKDVIPYIVAQCIGAICAAYVIYMIASGLPGFEMGGFACNGVDDHSPMGFSFVACAICEVVMTAVFLVVIMGSTDERAPKGFAPIAIGLCLTLIHLISIPVTNTSVNPARSLGPALVRGDWAMDQLWIFIGFPCIGAVIGGLLYRIVLGPCKCCCKE